MSFILLIVLNESHELQDDLIIYFSKPEVKKINELLVDEIVNSLKDQYFLILSDVLLQDGQELVNFTAEVILKINQVNVGGECLQDFKLN